MGMPSKNGIVGSAGRGRRLVRCSGDAPYDATVLVAIHPVWNATFHGLRLVAPVYSDEHVPV
jgi:hypothetical protein